MSDPLTSPVRREIASPLVAPVPVESPEAGRATSRFPLDPAEPLLAGHYPGFPIFPGVCLVECAHRTALGALGAPGRLTEVESARFLGPVFPGDTVHTEAVAETVDGGWRCRARLAAVGPGGDGRRQVAVVRLRYGAPIRTAARTGGPAGNGTGSGTDGPAASGSDGRAAGSTGHGTGDGAAGGGGGGAGRAAGRLAG